MLDPTLPEKQRARRRLVGAIALVLAAVVVLPMVLDSHPKPASDDIAVNIPRASKTPAALPPSAMNTPVPAADVTAPEDIPSDNPQLAASGVSPASAASDAPAKRNSPTSSAAPVQHAAAAKAPQTAPSRAASSASPNLPASQPVTHPAAGGNAAASRFVVSVGSFASDASAHAWLNKLKAAGVPAYLETRRLADGTQRTLLRAGPFSDRANAEAAVKKVRDAGLSAQSSTQSSAPSTAPGAAQ